MRRITWVLAMMMSVVLLLAACGQKDAEAVVKDLDNKMSKLESYEGIGTMTLYSGQQPLEYQVEVRYQDPSYYRIQLTNTKKDIKQIVLRNDEGVFVLTPSLKKSFRFQSDWPDNQGQVYLYQTLIHSILQDNSRQFLTEGDSYVFEVAANYQTDALVKQKIWLDKGDYKPKQVQVTDSEARVVVEMKFNQFEFNKKFDKDAFDMQANMTASSNIDPLPLPEDAANTDAVTDEKTPAPSKEGTEGEGQGDKKSEEDGAKDTQAAEDEATSAVPSEDTAAEEPSKDVVAPGQEGQEEQPAEDAAVEDLGSSAGPFGIIKPSYDPEGVTLKDEQEVNSDNHAVMLRYTGTYTYTIMESRQKDMEVGVVPGEYIDLGFTAGLLTGEAQKTLTWMDEGIKYQITSADLPTEEMVKIAQSMVDQPGK
ncbi:DUF4367 domain-containing protein [Paenibacillus sp. 1001270B_150601_E10]|uniref:DUF4367 domain-containing protein n=1 Tax=Paenibacillus sp. 1001270B_150601_E10 TaxID=2787079 RepID=UPI00189C776C|nr:DUF4367 domain-containing protein [Paenibacillus sp. 1001270B_150601_E10]